MNSSARLRFGDFVVDVAGGEVFRGAEALRLQQLPFRLLLALLERPGEVLTRAELAEHLWGAGTFVDSEAGLNTAVAKLREALGDTSEVSPIVQTVPRRGYRLVPLVSVVDATASGVPAKFGTRRVRIAIAAAILLAIAGGTASWLARVHNARVSVAVVLFDNETDRPEWDRLAQSLTDATVLQLTREPGLEVIGNAPELRTPRPFRDLRLVRDRVGARFILIGQLQPSGDGFRVMAHFIRAADLAHLWAGSLPLAAQPAPDDDNRIASWIAQAVRSKVRGSV